MNTTSKRSRPATNWIIPSEPSATHALGRQLKSALKKADKNTVVRILKGPGNVRGLIVRYGLAGEYIKLLRQAFIWLLDQEKRADGNDDQIIERVLAKHRFNFFLLADMMAVAFHLRDKELFFRLFVFFEKREKIIGRSEAYLFALNAFASWEGSYNQNHEKNLKLNKYILGVARKNHLEVMEQKAKFALSDHKAFKAYKPLKPGLRTADFIGMAAALRTRGVEYDALRAEMEAIDSQNRLLSTTTNERAAKKLIAEVLQKGKIILSSLKKIDYPKAIIRQKRILARSYELAGQTKTAKRLWREGEMMENRYRLLSIDKNQYI